MINFGRKTIGVFLSKAFPYFDDAFFHALEREGKRLGYDIAVFATVEDRLTDSDYDTQEKNTFSFAPVEKLDGILLVPDSFERGGFREALYDTLNRRARCPIVAVRHSGGVYDCAYTDDVASVRGIVKHLIEYHGLKKICFQTGFPGHSEAEYRLRGYREEMAAHGLEVTEREICEGTMRSDCGDRAYEAFFSDPENRPEAVVCANDYMAIGLARVLQEKGIRVPEDVILTGFDNIKESGTDVVSLTTIEPDFQQMTAAAMERLDQLIRRGEEENRPVSGGNARKRFRIRGRFIPGESCGCAHRPPDFFRHMCKDVCQSIERNKEVNISMNYFCINITACDNLVQLHEALLDAKVEMSHLLDYYLCLFSDENGIIRHEMSDKVCLVHAMKGQKNLGMPMTVFDRENLLPELAERDEPQMFYFKLLHQQGNNYGYSVFRYLPGREPSRAYVQWNVLIAGALQNIQKRNELMSLYEERRKSSVTDILTGLLNRRGMMEKLAQSWPGLLGQEIVMVSMDLDRLKIINDHYGHAAGDQALRLAGEAIRAAAQEGEAARMGGDEFAVFLTAGSREKAERFVRRLEENLRQAREENDLPYPLSVSTGFTVMRVTEETGPDQCLQVGDALMYREKKEHHRREGQA